MTLPELLQDALVAAANGQYEPLTTLSTLRREICEICKKKFRKRSIVSVMQEHVYRTKVIGKLLSTCANVSCKCGTHLIKASLMRQSSNGVRVSAHVLQQMADSLNINFEWNIIRTT